MDIASNAIGMIYDTIVRRVFAYADMLYRLITNVLEDVDLCHVVYHPPTIVYRTPWLPFVLRVVDRSSYNLQFSNDPCTANGVHARVCFRRGVLCSIVTRSDLHTDEEEGDIYQEPRRLRFLFAEANDVPCSKRLRNVYTEVPLTAFDVVALAGESGAKLRLIDDQFDGCDYMGRERVV